jgi:hypothetical protein
MKYFYRIWLAILLSSLLVEIIFKLIAFGEVFNIVFIRIILFNLIVSIIITLLISFFKPKVAKVITSIYVFSIGFYGLLQLTFYDILGAYMSFKASADSGLTRVNQQIWEFITAIKPQYLLLFVPFVLVLLSIRINKKKWKKSFNLNISQILVFSIIGVIVHTISLWTLTSKTFNPEYAIVSDKELYDYVEYQELGLNRLGMVKFCFRDLITTIFPKDKAIKAGSFIPRGSNSIKSNYKRKIDDTKWQKLINNETDKDILTLHNYYINRPITPKNEYTGIFKDKNFIFIMAEAFDYIAIDKDLTPTLYKLRTKGWSFEKNYRPKYSCTTGESEFISLVSIVPVSTVCTPNYFKNNEYPTSIFNLFNSQGYYSTSYHNYTDQYYSRTIVHKSMGSAAFYNRDKLKNPVLNGWGSDRDLIKLSTPYYMDKDKFFTFIITSSTHFPYDITSTIQQRHWAKVKNLDAPYEIKTYLAKSIELDLAIADLLADLEEHDKLDDTVIAIFGDHHPLRIELSYIKEYSDIDRTKDLDIDLNPFIIYTPNIEHKVITEVSDTFDLVPTIANLFNLDYDPRYYFGSDIFSDEEPLAIFNGGSWITEKGYYNAIKGEFTSYVDEEVPSKYINDMTNYVKGAFEISSKTLYTNYYKKRFSDTKKR